MTCLDLLRERSVSKVGKEGKVGKVGIHAHAYREGKKHYS